MERIYGWLPVRSLTKPLPPKTSGEYFSHQLKRLQSGLGDFSHKSQ
ncbi:hypothetical protein [Nostoc sp.]